MSRDHSRQTTQRMIDELIRLATQAQSAAPPRRPAASAVPSAVPVAPETDADDNYTPSAVKPEGLPDHCVIPHEELKPPRIARPNHLSINLCRRNSLKQSLILSEILGRPRAYDL